MNVAVAIDPAEAAVTGVDATMLRAEIDAILAEGKSDQAALLRNLRTWLDRRQTALRQRFEADHDAEKVVYDRCRLIDALVCARAAYGHPLDRFGHVLAYGLYHIFDLAGRGRCALAQLFYLVGDYAKPPPLRARLRR